MSTRRAKWVAGIVALAGIAVAAWGWLQFQETPSRLRTRARSALAEQHFDRASALIVRLERRQPLTAADWLLRAQAAIGRSRGDEALQALGQIADDQPEALPARMMEAYIALYQNRAAVMERSLKRALKIDPKQIKTHRELAKLYEVQGRRDELDHELQAIAELGPLSYDDLFAWCRSASSDREPGLAAETLRAYVRADPADRRSRLALADHLRKMGQLDEARTVLAPLPDSDTDAQVLRAEVARDRGDLAEAEALVRPLRAKTLAVLRLKALLALDRHDAKEAVGWFRDAHLVHPDDRDTLFGLGQALRLLGQRAEAEKLLKAAWARDELEVQLERSAVSGAKSSPEVFRGLGAACESIGRWAQAKAWYKLAIDANPLDTRAQESFHRLKAQLNSARSPDSY